MSTVPHAVTISGRSPAISIDYSLVRWSIVFYSLLMGNYLLWAFGAPAFPKIGLLAVLLSSVALFLLRNFPDHFLISLFFVMALLLTLGTPTDGWDVRSIWLFHAKRMFIDGSLYMQLDGYAPWSHNDYPGFVPALSATFALAMGYWNEVVPKSANVFVMLPAVCLLGSILEERNHILFLFVLILFIGRHFIFAGWMDPLLALYTTAFASLLYLTATFPLRNDTDSQRWSLVVALAFVAGILVLTKNEGLAVMLAVTFSFLISRLFLFNAISIEKSTILAVAISTIPLVWWKIACAHNGIQSDIGRAGFLSRLSERLTSPHDVYEIIRQLFCRRDFVVPGILFLFLVYRRLNNAFANFLGVCALTYSGVLFLVYLTTPQDLAWHLRTSTNRTILPISLLIGYGCLVMFAAKSASDRSRSC